MTLSLIIACIIIFIMLIMVPLLVSDKAEKSFKTMSEWEKIKEYGKKINENTRKKRD